LIERHHELTASERARGLLEGWSEQLGSFWRIAPKAAPTGDAVTPSETRASGETDTAVGLPQGG
jgi:glutamate synthase domain-containing protein 3